MLSDEGKMVKKQLEDLNQSKRRLRNLQEELKSWQNTDGVGSASTEQHVTGGEQCPFAERRAIKIEELKNLISQSIDEALTREDEFFKSIVSLDSLTQNLLMERYLTGKPLKKIIREFNYSDRQIYRLYDKAFEKLSKENKDGTKCH